MPYPILLVPVGAVLAVLPGVTVPQLAPDVVFSISLTAVDIPVATTSATASTTSASASFKSVGTTYRGFLINADRDFAQGKGPYPGYGTGAARNYVAGGLAHCLRACLGRTRHGGALLAPGVGRGVLIGFVRRLPLAQGVQ